MSTTAGYSVAVLGATGLVGAELVTVLGERRFPLADLALYSSVRSAGGEVVCGALTARIDLIERVRFEGVDIVFAAAGQQVTAEWAERIAESGAVLVDLSQLYVDDESVPLVVPEVNADEISEASNRRIVGSPDAPAIALATVLHPLQQASGLRRVVATSLEPVSGAGHPGIDELHQQTVELLHGRSVEAATFPHRIAFNIFPQIGEFLEGGASDREHSTAVSIRRLLHESELPVSITRVRVPVFHGAALSVHVETAGGLDADQAREILRGAPGVLVQDGVGDGLYPTTADAVGRDATCVGRIRHDAGANALDLWIAADNLRKGSAVNAVQIAELLVGSVL